MLEHGRLCEHCTATRCVDKPGPSYKINIACPSCDGAGCTPCNNKGTMIIDDCPSKMTDMKTREILRLCRLANKGALPVAGGTLDQSRQFIEALDLYNSDSSYWHNMSQAEAFKSIDKAGDS